MSDLHLSPDFETALRRGLSDLAASAPVPDDAHLDALERRSSPAPERTERSPRSGRPLTLVAAVVLVIAGLVGALALRDRDDRPRFDKVSGEITTTTPATSTTAAGPVLAARDLLASLDPTSANAPPAAGLMNGITDQATLAEVWAEAGLPADAIPTIDFSQEVVVEVVLDDAGCPSPDLELQKSPTAVRAHVVEPATCTEPLATTGPRVYFYALRWTDTGRPFNLDLVDPTDPDAFGSITVD